MGKKIDKKNRKSPTFIGNTAFAEYFVHCTVHTHRSSTHCDWHDADYEIVIKIK